MGCIIKKNAHLHGNLPRINPDIRTRSAVGTGPVPHIPEQPPVEIANKGIIEYAAAASSSHPSQPLLDVCLLKLVEFLPCGDVGGTSARAFHPEKWALPPAIQPTSSFFPEIRWHVPDEFIGEGHPPCD